MSADQRIDAWHKIASHPFFRPCYDTADPLLGSMLERLDALDRAIVIDRAALPEVVDAGAGDLAAPGAGGMIAVNRSWTAAAVRKDALAYLALAEYLEAHHPPVDPEQVEALDAAIKEADPEIGVWDRGKLARRLVERGVRVEGVDK